MSNASGKRAVFWDRDGTLMEEVDYCSEPARVRAIAGAGAGLAALRNAGWLNVLITNQSGIGRGYFSVEQYEAVNAELFRQLVFFPDGVYFCPDAPEVASRHRKPSTGMVEDACRDLGIDPRVSWFVGDKEADMVCGAGAGCRTILVRTGYGKDVDAGLADFICGDASEAAKLILEVSGG